MRIGEVSKETGLTISNIRFYEKKGLLEPKRNMENKYRDYTESDIIRLKQIVLYRKMDFSVEMIDAVLKDTVSIKDALNEQLNHLQEKQERLQGSIDLCEEMILHSDVKELDLNYFLNYVKQKENSGHKFLQINDILSDYAIAVGQEQSILPPDYYIFSLNVGKLLRIFFALLILVMPILFLVDMAINPPIRKELSIAALFMLIITCWGSFIHFFRKYRKTPCLNRNES